MSQTPYNVTNIQKMVLDNLVNHYLKPGSKPRPVIFSEALDIGMGMPVSRHLGDVNADVTLPPKVRGLLMEAYKNGTAKNAAEFMQDAMPAAVKVVEIFSKEYRKANSFLPTWKRLISVWLRGKIGNKWNRKQSRAAQDRSARDWTISRFRKCRAEIEQSDPVEQLAFCIAMATLWKAFLAVYNSPSDFAVRTYQEQLAYYKKLLAISANPGAHSIEIAVPAELLAIYLSAIIQKDRPFENEIAQFLDNKTKQGWDFV